MSYKTKYYYLPGLDKVATHQEWETYRLDCIIFEAEKSQQWKTINQLIEEGTLIEMKKFGDGDWVDYSLDENGKLVKKNK